MFVVHFWVKSFFKHYKIYCLCKIASLGYYLFQITFGELFSAQQNRCARFLTSLLMNIKKLTLKGVYYSIDKQRALFNLY